MRLAFLELVEAGKRQDEGTPALGNDESLLDQTVPIDGEEFLVHVRSPPQGGGLHRDIAFKRRKELLVQLAALGPDFFIDDLAEIAVKLSGNQLIEFRGSLLPKKIAKDLVGEGVAFGDPREDGRLRNADLEILRVGKGDAHLG